MSSSAAGPSQAPYRNVFAEIAHQLADAGRTVDVRDLQQKIGLRQRSQHLVVRERPMLVAHGGERDRHRAIAQDPADCVFLDPHFGRSELLRKPPDLTAAGDRRFAVEEHRVHVAAALLAVADGHDLPCLRVIAETGRVGHANELELHNRVRHLKRRRDDSGKRAGIGSVGDDQEFSIHEPVWTRRIGRARERHRKRAFPDFAFGHRLVLPASLARS